VLGHFSRLETADQLHHHVTCLDQSHFDLPLSSALPIKHTRNRRTKRVAPSSGQCNLRFLSTKVLQGSVATRVNYGRIFIYFFTANLLQSVMVKEF